MKLTPTAIENIELSGSYELSTIQAAWDRGNYGTLTDYDTGDQIRPATADEAIESYEVSAQGAITVDGRDVYVTL